MTTYMTPIEFTDAHAAIPGTDDGIGSWQPLSDDERTGHMCIDCGNRRDLRRIGRCADGPIRVCGDCYVQRLRDHIDYYRPQS